MRRLMRRLMLWPRNAWRPPAAVDAVVVLGAAVIAPGVPGPALARRIRAGVGLFHHLAAGHLLVSGGVVAAPPAEAHLMRAIAIEMGVADRHIVVEDRARNTFENAVYAGREIRARGWHNVVVVTDGYHLARALYVFRRLGLAVGGHGVPRPEEIGPLAWSKLHAIERLRLLRSAYLFARGTHHPVIAAVWGEAGLR